MSYSHIIFDLDGTITEPEKGITNGLRYALDRLGYEIKSHEELYKFIGPPLSESFRDFCGFSEEKTGEAIALYREYYSDRGILENDLMPGVRDALDVMYKQGKHLYIATSKPYPFTVKILEHLDIKDYFEYVSGASMDGKTGTKIEVLEQLIQNTNLSEHISNGEVIMVGDRKFDINGAKHFGIAGMGVMFGYGSREEFEAADADYIVNNSQEMLAVIME